MAFPGPRSLCIVLLTAVVEASFHAVHGAAGERHAVVNEKGSKAAQQDGVIEKVIQMLEENKQTIASDLGAESKEMGEYLEYCDDEQSEKGYAIKTASRKIDDLNAVIEDRHSQISFLDVEIAKLGTELAERHEEVDEATKLRKQENEEFKHNVKQMQLMIDELEKMEISMKQQMAALTTPPPVGEEPEADAAAPEGAFLAALMQVTYGKKALSRRGKDEPEPKDFGNMVNALSTMVNAVWVDNDSKHALGVLKGFMQNGQAEELHAEPAEAEAATPPPTVEVGADALAGFQKASEDNLQSFETLKGKAQEAVSKAQNEETTAQHNHMLRMQSLTDAINLAEDKLSDHKRDRSRFTEEKGKAEGELAEVKETKSADMLYLQSLKLECTKAASAWDARQKSAKDEMAAISQAKEILAKRVTVMVQQAGDDAGDTPQAAPAQIVNDAKERKQLINHFRKLGADLHSLAMLNLVSVTASEPLGQVKKLIEDLITKLEKEGAEAASVHAFCTEEKAKTKAAKEKKTMTIDKLDTRLEKAGAQKAALADSVQELEEEIAAIDKSNEEATKIRHEEKATNAKVVSDFKQAADAVEDALGALKDFYGESSLLQMQGSSASGAVVGKVAPPKLGGAQSDSAGGVLSILETMQTEFMKTVASTESTEREAAKAYDVQMNENKISKAAKAAEVKGSQSTIKSLTVAIHDFTEDHKIASKELDSILDYIQKLKPQCEGRVTPYAERKARRDAEIAGLKDAMGILASGASLVQVHYHLRH